MRAYISAHTTTRTDAENEQQTDHMFGELYRGGLKPRDVKGAYNGVREDAFSCPIPGASLPDGITDWRFQELLAIGRAYEQESVMLLDFVGGGAVLVSCATGAIMARGLRRYVGDTCGLVAWAHDAGRTFTVDWDPPGA